MGGVVAGCLSMKSEYHGAWKFKRAFSDGRMVGVQFD